MVDGSANGARVSASRQMPGTATTSVQSRYSHSRMKLSVLAGGCALAWTTLSDVARAADWEVTGDVTSQGYDVVSPWGDVVLGRRRLTSTLGVASYNLQGGDFQPFKATYSVQLRMRVDADFGKRDGETTYDPANLTGYVPGLQVAPVDMMYGYVEGRNLLGGAVDFKVGRQYTTNVLGWWSFDGAMARLTTPYYFAVEAFSGFEQRGGLPLSSARFESQGVWRGARDAALTADAQRYPSYQPAALAPAFGIGFESSGLNWIKSRIDYRRVYNSGTAFTGAFAFPNAGTPNSGGFETVQGLRVSSDRIGYSLSASLADAGVLRGGVVYDLYVAAVSRAFASVDVHINKRTTVGIDADYVLPVFDADSIFNWFSRNPAASLSARVAARPTDKLQLSANAGTKVWLTEGDPASWAQAQCSAGGYQSPEQLALCTRYGVDSTSWYTNPNNSLYTFTRAEENRVAHASADLVGNANAMYAWLTGKADVRAMLQTGFGEDATNRGRRMGATVSAQQALVPGIFWLGGRVSAYDWHDPLRPDRDATSFGYVIAPEVQPLQFGKLRVEWEHEMNRLVGQRFRVLALITMKVAP